VLVWILAFAVFLAGAGDFVVRYHPSWVAALRHIVPAQSAPAATGGKTTTSTAATTGTAGKGRSSMLTLMSPQPKGLPVNTTAYTLHSSPYTVAVTAGAQNAWVAAQADFNGQPVLPPSQQQTLTPGQTLNVNPTSGEEFIHIGAGGTTIKLYHTSALLAKVPEPAHCPCYILLVPTGH